MQKILEQNGTKYSDEDVFKIREILYSLAELDFVLYKQETQPKTLRVPRTIKKKSDIKALYAMTSLYVEVLSTKS